MTTEKGAPKRMSARDGASLDVVAANIDRLRELFPDAFTEGSDDDGPRWRLDLDALREIVGDHANQSPERYCLSWHGKAQARRIGQTPSTGTLRPCNEKSVDWDNTRNLFIEGDNLEVLKLLQRSYHRRVHMIYIDPPYNTGGDFIYPDKYQDQLATYLRFTNQLDREGLKLSANVETSGRFHTNWLNMMYPRLRLARNLLADDGLIFITIDDNELANLRHLCDEVFGEENFLANICWKHTEQSKNDEPCFSRHKNTILVYRKSAALKRLRFPRRDDDNRYYANPDDDPRGAWRSGDVRSPNLRPTLRYHIETPSGKRIAPPDKGWRWSRRELERKIASGEIVFSEDETRIVRKIYLGAQEGRTPENVWAGERYGTTRQANREIKELFDGVALFDTPKPTALIQRMLELVDRRDALVLDFFAGSCATAHAVLEQNAVDGGERRFVMVQLPEPCPEGSAAWQAGYPTIADIGAERLRRVIRSLEARGSGGSGSGAGFRFFRLDTSNIVAWDPDRDRPEESLFGARESVKDDRSEDDILTELLLKFGLDLAVPIETRSIAGAEVSILGAGALVVCLSESVGLGTVEGIAALRGEFSPAVMRVVFRDSGFADDVVKTNAVQTLRQAGIEDVKSL